MKLTYSMGKQIDIPVPATLRDYTLEQTTRLLDYFASEKHPHKVQDMIDCIHAVTQMDKDILRRCDVKTGLIPVYEHIQKTLRHKLKEPPTQIKINGVTYVFDQKISSETWTAGRLIDADNRAIEIDKHPQYICALCYIEKGKKYDYPESEGGCMPLEDRAEIMRQHFNGEDYLDLYAFFLKKFYQLSPGFSILQIARAQIYRQEAERRMRDNG